MGKDKKYGTDLLDLRGRILPNTKGKLFGSLKEQ